MLYKIAYKNAVDNERIKLFIQMHGKAFSTQYS